MGSDKDKKNGDGISAEAPTLIKPAGALEADETIGIYMEPVPDPSDVDELYTNISDDFPPPTDLALDRPDFFPAPSTDEIMREEAAVEPWKTLHPASCLVNLIPQGWRTLRALWPLLLALFIGGEGMGMRFLDLGVILLFFALSIWNTIIHWITLRYRMNADRLEIKSGLLNRQSRTIDPSRIQNMEMVRTLFHSMAGLVELRIETAGDGSTEGLLSALSVAEAERLRTSLAQVGSLAQTAEGEDDGETLLRLGLLEILAYGLTRRTIGTVAIITAVGLEVVGNMGPDATRNVAITMKPSLVVAAFLLAFAASWAFSAVTSLLRFFRFRLLRLAKDALCTEAGLTTRRRVEIPLSKVQLVRVDEPLVRRMMGYGTLSIETAGLGVSEGQVRQAEGMVPMVATDDLAPIAAAASPSSDVDPWSTVLHPAHPRALYRSALAALARAGVIMVPLFLLIESPLKWGVWILPIVSLWGAWLDWKKQGWIVTDHTIVARRGFFLRRTWIVSRDKLQSVHRVQGPFMRLHGLTRIVIRVAGSQIALPDTGEAQGEALMQTLAG